MKYLKKYNEANDEFPISLNKENIVNDLKDMLLDINDSGFWTSVEANNYVITVTISRLRNVKGFIRDSDELDSIKSVLQRIKNYAKDNRLNIDNTWLNRTNDILIGGKLDDFNHLMNNNRCTMYITMYPKK